MDVKFRCDCPITSALDILGDKWILVIIKQMIIQGKETFKDFTDSDESIATNILTVKLKYLEELGFVTKSKLPNNKKTVYYHLTDKGLSLTSIIVELAIWSDEYLRELHSEMQKPEELTLMKSNKELFIKDLIASYKEKTTVRPSTL
ncbi:MAG: helix-turn-helix domain-containing protein [Bacteroidia bacterium]